MYPKSVGRNDRGYSRNAWPERFPYDAGSNPILPHTAQQTTRMAAAPTGFCKAYNRDRTRIAVLNTRGQKVSFTTLL